MEGNNSLGELLDQANQYFFNGQKIPVSEYRRFTTGIASTIDRPGSYAGMFAPTAQDFNQGVRVFTGEPIRSRAGIAHVLGEEACRILIILNSEEPDIRETLNKATSGMLQRLHRYENEGEIQGMYCCGTCSGAFWRNLAAGGLDQQEERLYKGMKILKSLRTGDGHWRRFPFAYTMLALSEIDPTITREEIRYAAPVMERYIKTIKRDDIYTTRKRDLFNRILSRN